MKNAEQRAFERKQLKENIYAAIQKDSGYKDFIIGSPEVYEFIKAIGINNKEYLDTKEGMAIQLNVYAATKIIKGQEYSGFNMYCTRANY